MKKKSKIKITFILLILTALACGIGYAFYTKAFKADNGKEQISLFTVKQGHLTISVVEAATIKARDVEIIKSQVEGNTTVLWVIPEATEVKKGDKLIELDASELKDDKDKQEIVVLNAKTSADIAEKTLEVVKNKAQSDIAQAELTLELAKKDLEKYVGKEEGKEDGEYDTQLKDSQKKIDIAKMEVERTKEKLDGSKELYKDKYISKTEFKSDEIAWEKAKLDLELQESQLYLLKNYTHPRTLKELNNNVMQSEMALVRINLSSGADIYEAQEQLTAAKAKRDREKSILDKINDQISKATIYAPTDGMVIYASSTRASWRGNDEPLQEGENVHEREELFHLPKADLVSAVANIHEANLDKVKQGSPVTIKVDAVPGEVFTGIVGSIALMPDARMVYINPNLKVYKTEMFIDEKPDLSGKLRTGMGCQVEIVAAEYENAVYIPIQAVITVGEQHTVYVYENGELKPKPVEIGQDNNRMVHIISGLEKGQQVLLTPPLSKAQVRNGEKQGKNRSAGSGGKKPGSGPGRRSGEKPARNNPPNSESR